MRVVRRSLAYGLIVWLVPFVISVLIYPLKASWPVLFDSIMPVVLAIVTVTCFAAYAREWSPAIHYQGLTVGLVWLGVSWALDLPMFLTGPMQMPIGSYFADIGLTYLMIPAITAGASRVVARAA